MPRIITPDTIYQLNTLNRIKMIDICLQSMKTPNDNRVVGGETFASPHEGQAGAHARISDDQMT